MISFDKYYEEMISEIRNRAHIDKVSEQEAFCEYAGELLIEGEVLTNPQYCEFKSPRDGISINGYELSDEMNTLNVIITDLSMDEKCSEINREEATSLLEEADMFIYSAITEQFELTQLMEENPEIHNLATTIENNSDVIRHASVHLITNRDYKYSEEVLDQSIENTDISYHIWDIKKIFELDVQGKSTGDLHIKIKKQFGDTIRLIKTPVINETYECYIGYVPGLLLAKAYEYYGNQLMERNVRSYLQARGKINRGIINTAKNSPEMFTAYNNGLTTIAEDAVFLEHNGIVEITELTGWQIVNGGQTTASLYRAFAAGEDLRNLNVQIKLNLIKDKKAKDDLISKISEYANSQNKISISDLRSNDAFQADLERLSYRISVQRKNEENETYWFYERTRGQYNTEVNRKGKTPSGKKKYQKKFPKSQVVTKTDAAKYIMSWDMYPHTVSRGAEANFLEFCNKVKKDNVIADELYFRNLIAKTIIFRTLDNLVKELGFKGYKANLVTYSLAAFSLIKKGSSILDQVWLQQEVPNEIIVELKTLISLCWNHITNPPIEGANVTQYCKKVDCWDSFKKKILNHYL